LLLYFSNLTLAERSHFDCKTLRQNYSKRKERDYSCCTLH